MKLSFTGTYEQKVDTKSRMSIPVELRRVLEAGDPEYAVTQTARVAILYGPHLDNHLCAYSVRDFSKIAANVTKMKRGSKDQRNTARLILGFSRILDVDKDGRVILPREMRDKIGLDKEVQYVGLGEYFEIRNKASVVDIEEDLSAWLQGMGDDFDPLSLVPDLDADEEV